MVIILWNKEIMAGISKWKPMWIVFCSVITIMIFVSVISIILLKKGKKNKILHIQKISRPDDTVLSYIMTYVIPLISGSDANSEVFLVNFLLFILIGYIYIRLNLIYLNPLWAIFGYAIYRSEDERIIVTNIPITRMKLISSFKGFYLSNGIFVAHNKDNLE